MSADLNRGSQLEMQLRSFMQQPKRFTVNIINELLDRDDITPDISELRKYKYIPVVVYCDLKGTFDHAPTIFSDSKYLGECFSCADNFKMYTTKEGDAVVVQKTAYSPGHCARIKGNCWAVPPETLLALDRYMANGFRTNRKKCNFFLHDQVIKTAKNGRVIHPSLQCWIYLGIPSFYLGSMDRGIKTKNILVSNKPNTRPYYSHMRGLY